MDGDVVCACGRIAMLRSAKGRCHVCAVKALKGMRHSGDRVSVHRPRTLHAVRTCQCGGCGVLYDSRETRGGIRRLRACELCGARWTTYEVVISTEARPFVDEGVSI